MGRANCHVGELTRARVVLGRRDLRVNRPSWGRVGLPPFVGENTEHIGTDNKSTRWWNAEDAECERVI